MDIVKVTCCGKTETMTRKDAIALYTDGVICTEGSEQQRYSKILAELMAGCTECSDEY